MNSVQLFRIMAAQGPLNTVRFLQDWRGIIRTYFLYAGIESGLLEALQTPKTAERLVEVMGVARRELLDGLLEVGLATKELAKKNEKFVLRGKRAKALAGNKEGMFTGLVQAAATYYHVVFEGTPKRLEGAPLTDLIETYAEIVARFSKGSEPFILDFLKRIVGEKEPLRLLEVGCGSGVHLRSIHSTNPQVSGIGLDMNETVVNRARENLNLWGLQDKFNIVHGDIRRQPTEIEGEFDLITLFNLIYYFEPDKRPALFKSLRERLSAGGRLAIVTYTRTHGKDVMGAALNLATITDIGCTALPDLEQLKSQLRKSGFGKIRVKPLIPQSTFMGILAEEVR